MAKRKFQFLRAVRGVLRTQVIHLPRSRVSTAGETWWVQVSFQEEGKDFGVILLSSSHDSEASARRAVGQEKDQ